VKGAKASIEDKEEMNETKMRTEDKKEVKRKLR